MDTKLMIVKNDSTQNLTEHFHNAHEILYVSEGTVKANISGTEYTAGSGTLIFISNLEIHQIDPVGFPYIRYFALIPTNCVNRITQSNALGTIFTNRSGEFKHCIDVNGFKQEIEALFQKMHMEYSDDGIFAADFIFSYLNLLLIILYRNKSDAFPQPKSNVEEIAYKVKEYIEAHYAEDIRVGDIAKKFYMDSFYLSHVFKRATGYNPKQFIMLCRLARARALLYDSNMPIVKVAEQSGFVDVNNFIRYFKKEVGLTPLQYRKSARIH